jgi:hypothetical protein
LCLFLLTSYILIYLLFMEVHMKRFEVRSHVFISAGSAFRLRMTHLRLNSASRIIISLRQTALPSSTARCSGWPPPTMPSTWPFLSWRSSRRPPCHCPGRH